MKPFFSDDHIALYNGDARHLDIPDESVDLIFTSPPYYGKRSYGDETVAIWGGMSECSHLWVNSRRYLHSGRGDAQKSGKYSEQEPIADTPFNDAFCQKCGAWFGSLGLEPTWQMYINHLCLCAKEWFRVLKKTGNLMIDIGDTFSTHTSKRSAQFGGDIEDGRNDPFTRPRPRQNYPEKMKLGIPHRLRFALNDMGWVSRDDIIWYKGKEYIDHISKVAMPESVKDRLSCSYEMIFHFVKSKGNRCERYWFDLDSIRTPHLWGPGKFNIRVRDIQKGRIKGPQWKGSEEEVATYNEKEEMKAARRKTVEELSFKPEGTLRQAPEPGEPHAFHPGGANPGDLWIIQPEPFALPHYATFPSQLCERVIKVACPQEVCRFCGQPRERIVQVERPDYSERFGLKDKDAEYREQGKAVWGGNQMSRSLSQIITEAHDSKRSTIGWSSCDCNEGFVPGVILDPFCGGSGRAARMARKLGRKFIGVDLKEEYLELSKSCYLRNEKEAAEELKAREVGYSQPLMELF